MNQSTGFAAWVKPRQSTFRMVLLGTLSYPVVFALCWELWPALQPIQSATDRVLLALQLCVAPAAMLACCVFCCLRLLDTPSAENPLAGAESVRWKIDARVLQNTVEQALIFVPLLLALAIRIEPEQVRLLPVLVAIWMAGRVLFWIGFRRDFPLRAVGFDWTFYTSLLALAWFVATLF